MYLERFSSLSKNKTNFLLFKYYRRALKLQLGDIQSANTEYLEFVMQYTEEIISIIRKINILYLLNCKMIY